MTATKTNLSKINYNIKLLAGNNVVMVEANGYESEIFVPHILKGRIGFLNVIPNRRCCQMNTPTSKATNITNGTAINTMHGQAGTDTNRMMNSDTTTPTTTATTKTWRMTAGQENPNNASKLRGISNSLSPSRPKHSTSLNTYKHTTDKHIDTSGRLSKALQITGNTANKSMEHSTQLYKVIRGTDTNKETANYTPAHSFFTNSTFHDKSMSRISSLSANFRQTKNTIPPLNSKYNTNNHNPKPNLNQNNIKNNNSNNNNNNNNNEEVKWRKANLPTSTGSVSASRRGNSTIVVQRKAAITANRKPHSLTAIPSYIYSPTVPIKINHKSEMRKRKLQNDKKSSNTFKSLKSHSGKFSSAVKTKSKSKKSNVINKSHSNNKSNLHVSSFDLLRNPNSTHHKYNSLYRKGCTSNASSATTTTAAAAAVAAATTTQKVKNVCPTTTNCREYNSKTDPNDDQLPKIIKKSDLPMHSHHQMGVF